MAYEPPSEDPAKFNIGLDAQKIVAEILKRIYRLNADFYTHTNNGALLNAGQAQHQKYRNLISLNLAATPLYDDEDFVKEMTGKIQALKPKTKDHYDRVGKTTTYIEVYDEEIDMKINNLIQEILIKLQPIFRPTDDFEGL